MYEVTNFAVYITLLIGLLTVSGILAFCVKFHFQKEKRHAFTQTKYMYRTEKRFAFTQTKYLTKKNRNTQTDLKETKTVQTETMRFTERITNFDTEQVSSSEIFDNCCEICMPNLEKESVGFCKACEKFMCLHCCKHHERIPLSDSHTLLGKENYQRAKEKIPKIENHLVPVQTYTFKECDRTICASTPWNYCISDHYIQALGLGNIPNSGEICSILHRYSRGSVLSWRYEDLTTGTTYNSDILQGHSAANDICTTQARTKGSLKEISSNAFYFTLAKATTVWKYEINKETQKKEPNKSNTNEPLTINGNTTKEFYKNGQCFGIAAFDNGLAISLFIPTSYTLPDWQIQYVTFTGTVKRQIYYDNEGQPLFKQPKYLTSNDAQDVLYVSDQGTDSVIALDTKGTVLFKFTNETIKCPRGLTCDDEGNIYVACENNVLQINQHGTKSRIILSSSEKQPKMLIDVCFNKVSQKLAVVNKSSEVTVFKFLP